MDGRSKLVLALTYVRYRLRELHQWYTSTTVTVDTGLGKVRGVQVAFEYGSGGRYAQFQGIPYARPPVGDLRFCVSVALRVCLTLRGRQSGAEYSNNNGLIYMFG